jgi:glutamine amidotransferase
MGWNAVEVVGDPPALRGIPSGTYFYFVHSYYAAPKVPGDVACRSTYGVPFAAAVCRGNRLAVQFHPEKSQALGLSILKRFGEMKGDGQGSGCMGPGN